MRTLLIIQSLIIALGAYYIYTIAHTRDGEFDRQPDIVDSKNVELSPEIKDLSEATEFDTDADQLLFEGNNDIGMEFPIPDWDI
jgi:hypothetical protein